ncbi:hypothetical protein QUF90_11855 [Desulfococcaceae bacterium HSG9]|nr:hypothetical protein [Desulfococcaceae bacterium HSG9]
MPSFVCSATRIEIDPRIQISHSYDDNIALEHENAKSDQITTLSPQLLISWHAPQTDLEFEYAPSWMSYQTYTERNYLQHNGNLSFKHRFNKHTDFDFQDQVNTTDNFLDVPVVSNWDIPEARGVYYTNNTTAQMNHRFGQKNSINAGYNYRVLINKDVSLLSAKTTAPDDTVRHGPFAKLNYQFNIQNSLVLEYSYVRNLHKRSDAVISNRAFDTASDDTEDDSEKDGISDDDEEPEQEDASAMDNIVIDRDIFNDDEVSEQEDASAMDNIVIDRDIFNDNASNQEDTTVSDEENTDKELIVNNDASGQEDDTVSDEENTDKELIVNDDASDQEDGTASDKENADADDEDAASETADEVASDKDFDDQTLTIGYIYRFDRHIESNIKQRIFIHRMVVSDRSSEDYQVYDTTVGLDYTFSRHTKFSLEAGYSRQQGDSSHTSEGMLFNSSINHQRKHGSMSLAVQNGWDAESPQEYSLEEDTNEFTRYWGIEGNINYQPWQNVETRAGSFYRADSPQESSFEEDTDEFTRYWGIEGNINYQPWQNVETRAGLFYRNDTGSSSTSSETWQANCGADIGIATWMALSLNYNHQFRIEEQEDQTIDGDCTLNINALPWLVVGLNYQYSSSISDIPENQYVDNRFTLNLSAARTQPYFWNF